MKPDHVEVPVEVRVDLVTLRRQLEPIVSALDAFGRLMIGLSDGLADALASLDEAAEAERDPLLVARSSTPTFEASASTPRATLFDGKSYNRLVEVLLQEARDKARDADHTPADENFTVSVVVDAHELSARVTVAISATPDEAHVTTAKVGVAEPVPPKSDWREFPLSVYLSDAVRTDPERYAELLVRMQRDLHGEVHQNGCVPVSQDVVAYESDEVPGLWQVTMTIKAYGHTDEGDDA